MKKVKFTYNQWLKRFPDDTACLEYLLVIKNPTKSCPSCATYNSLNRTKNRRSYQCSSCSYQVYPTAGTIFHKTTTPLHDWFFIIFSFIKSKNGLSAKEVEREMEFTYKTALRMLRKIREACSQEISSELMSGMVEMDEAYIGGKNKFRHIDKKIKSHGRYQPDKGLVFGMKQHGGKMKAVVVENSSWDMLSPHIFKNVEKGTDLYTDELPSYRKLKKNGYNHEFIQHGVTKYRNGNCSTNAVESFWAYLKRGIKGAYIHVTKQYLQQYVDEAVFKFNNRDNPYIFDDLISLGIGVIPQPHFSFFEDH